MLVFHEELETRFLDDEKTQAVTPITIDPPKLIDSLFGGDKGGRVASSRLVRSGDGTC